MNKAKSAKDLSMTTPQVALPNSPIRKLASVHPNPSSMKRIGGNANSPPRRSSREASVKFAPSIDEDEVVEHNHLEDTGVRSEELSKPSTIRPLKSCMSAPNLSGMASSMKRNVSFHKIEIREYERTLGDHPSVSSGPPISLDWKVSAEHSFCVEEYEKGKTPRTRAEMIIPKSVRELMLKEHWDVSRNEMNAVTREVNLTKRNRRATARSTTATEKRQEKLENASRKMKRIIKLGKNKDERKLWKDVKTMCGKRVCSMNDLAVLAAVARENERRQPLTTSTSTPLKPEFETQDSLSSSGNESATSLPVTSIDDDDWGLFGYDDEEHDY